MPRSFSINQHNPYYPNSLLDLPNPPKTLYCCGNLDCLKLNLIAIVGARQASPEGLVCAHYYAKSLVNHGFSIISGLARGIDTAAHTGALSLSQRLATVAILPTSLNKCYPPENIALLHQIELRGLVITEYQPHQPIFKSNFRDRNRIIAALCKGVLIVEASDKSGALITANWCAQLGKEVFVIPHKPWDKNAAGCNRLIQQGAKLVTNIADILEELIT